MKKGFILMLAIAGIATLSSCSKKKGPSEETKQLMTTFETDWQALGDQINGWETTMTSTMSGMTTMMTETRAVDLSKLPSDAKAMAETNLMMCTKIEEQMAAMKTGYATAKSDFATATDEYSAWKKKGQEEHLDDATIAAEMANWNAKLTEWKGIAAGWNEQLTGMQDACKQTCDAVMGMAPAK